VIAWPAIIALRLGYDDPAWPPLWLPVLLATGHMLGLAFPVLLAERKGSRDALRRRFGQVQTMAEILALEPNEFEAWSAMLFQLMGYHVATTGDAADHGVDLLVSSDEVRRGLVQCKRYRGTVGEPVVRDLYGTMVHENADRGWLVTAGAISNQARAWSYAKPIELWDGQSLLAMAKRYR
jgi:restriction system protein